MRMSVCASGLGVGVCILASFHVGAWCEVKRNPH